MTRIKLTAETRTELGRAVKKLRRVGRVPANVFGRKITSFAVSIDAKEFKQVFSKAGETGLVDLVVDGKAHPVLVSEVQIHPVTGLVIHVDFHEVDLTEKVTATVPVELIGEAPAIKNGVGTMVQQMDEIEVQALPADLPEKFEVDITGLTDIDSAVYVKDITFDSEKVTIETDMEQIIAKISEQQKEEEPVAAPVEGAEGEAASAEGTPEAAAESTDSK